MKYNKKQLELIDERLSKTKTNWPNLYEKIINDEKQLDIIWNNISNNEKIRKGFKPTRKFVGTKKKPKKSFYSYNKHFIFEEVYNAMESCLYKRIEEEIENMADEKMLFGDRNVFEWKTD